MATSESSNQTAQDQTDTMRPSTTESNAGVKRKRVEDEEDTKRPAHVPTTELMKAIETGQKLLEYAEKADGRMSDLEQRLAQAEQRERVQQAENKLLVARLNLATAHYSTTVDQLRAIEKKVVDGEKVIGSLQEENRVLRSDLTAVREYSFSLEPWTHQVQAQVNDCVASTAAALEQHGQILPPLYAKVEGYDAAFKQVRGELQNLHIWKKQVNSTIGSQSDAIGALETSVDALDKSPASTSRPAIQPTSNTNQPQASSNVLQPAIDRNQPAPNVLPQSTYQPSPMVLPPLQHYPPLQPMQMAPYAALPQMGYAPGIPYSGFQGGGMYVQGRQYGQP